MAFVFLDAVNASLKRVRVIQGDVGELSTSTVSTATGAVPASPFEVSSIQSNIDIMLQCWNQAFRVVYGMGMFTPEVATATIVLVTAQREYALPADFETMAGRTYQTRVIRGATRFYEFPEYIGGFDKMLADQPGFASIWQGEPIWWAMSPVQNTIRMDREPTSIQNGWTYNYLYTKRLVRSSTMATETMPFSDTVTEALVPAVAQAWEAIFKKSFDEQMFRQSIAEALEFMTFTQRKDRYGPRIGRTYPRG